MCWEPGEPRKGKGLAYEEVTEGLPWGPRTWGEGSTALEVKAAWGLGGGWSPLPYGLGPVILGDMKRRGDRDRQKGAGGKVPKETLHDPDE